MAKKKGGAGLMKNVQDAAGLTVGAVIASKVSNINLPVPAAVKPALPLLLGFFLMKRGGFMGNVGAGMIARGGTQLLGTLVPQLGISAQEGVSEYVIEGAEDYALSGAEDYALSGGDEYISETNTSYALSGMEGDYNADMLG